MCPSRSSSSGTFADVQMHTVTSLGLIDQLANIFQLLSPLSFLAEPSCILTEAAGVGAYLQFGQLNPSLLPLLCRRSTNLYRMLQRYSSNPTELEELTELSFSKPASQVQKRCTHWRRPSQETNEIQEQAAAPAYAALSVAGNRLIEAASGEASRRRPLSSNSRKSMFLTLSRHLSARTFSRSGKPQPTGSNSPGRMRPQRAVHALATVTI